MMHGWQSEPTDPRMDPKVLGVVRFGVVAVVMSPTTAGCSVTLSL